MKWVEGLATRRDHGVASAVWPSKIREWVLLPARPRGPGQASRLNGGRRRQVGRRSELGVFSVMYSTAKSYSVCALVYGTVERTDAHIFSNKRVRKNFKSTSTVLSKYFDSTFESTVKVHRYSATICATVGIVLRPTRRLSVPYNHKSSTVHTVSSVIYKITLLVLMLYPHHLRRCDGFDMLR
jgi:hypothetical protein